MQACDFSRSFFTFRIDIAKKQAVTTSHKLKVQLNNGRIMADCICDLTRPDGSSVQYVLGASCKSERVGVDADIWTEPNADFAPVISQDRYLLIKRWDRVDKGVMLHPPTLGPQPQRQCGATADAYDNVKINIHRVEARVLPSTQHVVEAGLADQPLVARTEFDTDDGWHAALEYPIKTINLSDRDELFQPDTGPVLWPQNPGSFEWPEESLQLAYIAFHQPDWAELLINAPTEIADGISVHHYSKPLRVDCTNTMMQLL